MSMEEFFFKPFTSSSDYYFSKATCAFVLEDSHFYFKSLIFTFTDLFLPC